MSVCNFVYSRDLGAQLQTIFATNFRCDVSAFDLRRSMHRLSKIDASTFEDRCVDFRSVSTFEDLCVAVQRSMCCPSKIDVTMCRPSEIDVSTFEDRCVDLRR